MKPFYHILGNTLVASVTNFTVWFALTFWVYLETQSVFATGMLAGIYLVLTAGSGFWFGSIVDHHKKKLVMLASSAISFLVYGISFVFYLSAPEGVFALIGAPWIWILMLLLMLGVTAGNLRSIALPTLVTLLIPEDRRDKANGLVGMVTGVGFLTTSVISGFLVAWGGMFYVFTFALILTGLVFAHLLTVRIPEDRAVARDNEEDGTKKGMDIPGTIRTIRAVPGLFPLIFFATFNNFLGGAFMALLDPYGLSLVSVQTWGVLVGVLSTAMILSGILISKIGLGKNPLRTLLLVNMIAWSVCIIFPIQSSIILLAAGMFSWMFLGPFMEAAEHTTLQKVVPVERQGRVFGFAQSLEQAASPVTAFLIGPITQFFFIPLMTTGAGVSAIGDWFGTGPARGMALVFMIAGAIGLCVTIAAFNSRAYKSLSARYITQDTA